jgi:hypothetical protein
MTTTYEQVSNEVLYTDSEELLKTYVLDCANLSREQREAILDAF